VGREKAADAGRRIRIMWGDRTHISRNGKWIGSGFKIGNEKLFSKLIVRQSIEIPTGARDDRELAQTVGICSF
jgi:hypothetical protein